MVVTLPTGKLTWLRFAPVWHKSVNRMARAAFATDRKLAIMATPSQESFRIGKILFTPFSRLAEDGGYKAGLSIKRGQGSATHDRVSIYMPTFTTVESALTYAHIMGKYESISAPTAA
jgi:hypothetical protein